MGKKLFYQDELNGCWSTAREKGMEYARVRGHSPNTLHNDQKDMLYAGCEMQDIGCMNPAEIDQSIFNRWREYTMSDGNRNCKAITEKGFKKRKEAMILLLRANQLNEQLAIIQMHRSNIRHERLEYWDEDELEAIWFFKSASNFRSGASWLFSSTNIILLSSDFAPLDFLDL
jgi:hypothetical protein